MSDVRELVTIKTTKFDLTIKGKPYHPQWEQIHNEQEQSSRIEIMPLDCKVEEWSYFAPAEENLVAGTGNLAQLQPLFFEWQDYEIIITASKNTNLEFYHSNQQLREAVTPLSSNQNILTGTINFRTDVGFSKLEIREEGEPLFNLQLEVYPSKLDYKTDYEQLLQEVNQEVYNLAYDFLRRAFNNLSPQQAENVSHSEFFTILDNIFNKFKQAFRRIEQAPHHRLEANRKVKPAARVRKINQQSIKWLKKNPQHYDQATGRPTKCLDMEKDISYNTFENKFVKWVIFELKKRLFDFKEEYQEIHGQDADPELLARIEDLGQELDYMSDHTFLQEVSNLQKLNSLSLVLQLAPGYRELYKYFLMLRKGLSLSDGLFNLSMKETWKLYEYWCFLKLNQILRKRYNLLESTLIDIDYSGISVTLRKGKTAQVKYEHPQTKEKFTLTYNAKAGASVTTGQKPDNILSLSKEDSAVDYKFVFDAKYRLNPAEADSSYSRQYQSPGPEEGTINTMHRYRDAILARESNGAKRTVVGAYVLFPYNNEQEFKEHHFYKSIEEVNVGAFPFLPGNIELVADFLEKLVNETSLSNFERNVLPQGEEEYQTKLDFEQNVLVGSIRSQKQFEIMQEQNFYYIPVKRADFVDHPLEYIALYQSKKKFSEEAGVNYYAEIKDYEIMKRKDIPVPLTHNNSNEDYYYFELSEWQELDQAVNPADYGLVGSHIYTNYLLLQKADSLDELKIDSLKQWRKLLEEKRQSKL
ncbi:restriction endonuclease-like protein [Halanaerobacter jeridensis]|uniref:Component of viral defense system (DUF524 family) n=1 Tax=Halanaerobacter jeridensis TaxID=706427 RepID=A0A939BNN3_9FIRM|nr:restriction endonuclease-like protein [Halanaerobacter jeridensis]MBM7555787.1 putative component of viral defense system (DUF524 family) [Halanaerobacter jeridensis]